MFKKEEYEFSFTMQRTLFRDGKSTYILNSEYDHYIIFIVLWHNIVSLIAQC
jgi:hypothetical protein